MARIYRRVLSLALWLPLALAALLAFGACSSSSVGFRPTSSPVKTAESGQLYSYQVMVTAAEGAVTYSLVGAPAGMIVSGSGLVQWTPAHADLGTHTVAIDIGDGSSSFRQSWNLRVHQGVDLGVTLSPRRHTGASSTQDFNVHFDPTHAAGPLRAFHSTWRDAVTDDGQIPMLGTFAGQQAALFGFTLVMGFGWSDGNGAPDLASESDPGDNSWTNAETRAEYQAMVTLFAQTYQPPYLFLGNETNNYYVTHTPTEWSAWISEFEACYDAIKLVSPSTIVFTTFNLEKMKGLGVKNGWSYTPHWNLVTDHASSGKIDAIGFTSYPYFEYDTPALIPAGYYDEILTYWSGPTMFSEIGWPGSPNFPYPGSQQQQVDFIAEFFARTDDLALAYVAWLFLHDWDDQATTPAFTDIGFRSNDATTIRSADADWRTEVALRQK